MTEPSIAKKNSQKAMYQHKTHQHVRTDLEWSIGVAAVTQLVWLTGKTEIFSLPAAAMQ